MKITVEHIESEENEVILRCRELDDEMLRLLALVRAGMQKLLVWNEQKELLPLNVSETVYCETVEEKTFVYTENGMYQTALTLSELEERWAARACCGAASPVWRTCTLFGGCEAAAGDASRLPCPPAKKS